jgi:3-hydroxy-3-methylglutaryl CoA synthase
VVGITSYGAYIPRLRLRHEDIARAWSSYAAPGESAVANFDEDSLTMGVAAAFDCLRGVDRRDVDGVFFASTTSPFREQQASSVIASALDLREDILTADYAQSLRAATQALSAASDAVKSGRAGKVLVIAADCRPAAPGSMLEGNVGHGAAAVLVGDDGVIAGIEGEHSISSELIDTWRTDHDRFVKTWEDRFVVSEGFARCVKEAVAGLIEKCQLEVGDFDRAVIYGPDPRSLAGVRRSLGIQDEGGPPSSLFSQVGNTGAAFALMMLVEALETASSGETLLFVSYGDGSDAFVLKVTDDIEKTPPRSGIRGGLEPKRYLASYQSYLSTRSLVQREPQRLPPDMTSAPQLWRDQRQILGFEGQKCRVCGVVQYPKQRLCVSCQARDQFDDIRLSDSSGEVFTFTRDYVAASPSPPVVTAFVDLEEGGRVFCEITDCDPEKIEIGTVVEMTFRMVHEAAGIPHYSWKGRPVTQGET